MGKYYHCLSKSFAKICVYSLFCAANNQSTVITVISITAVLLFLMLASIILIVAVIVWKSNWNKCTMKNEHIYEKPEEVNGVVPPMIVPPIKITPEKHTQVERENSILPPSEYGGQPPLDDDYVVLQEKSTDRVTVV